jgi:HAE1 family hydrophobic/amphiphilic exporter-1
MAEHKHHDSDSYLSNLKFDPALKETWWGKYITNIRVVILLIVTVFALGAFSYSSLPTRLNPQINIAIVTVNTILPGASPEDVETLLTKPIEKELDGVKGVTSMTSTSVDNASTVVLQFESNVPKEKARQDVQTAVETVTGLPEDAKTPVVNALDFDDAAIWTFSITSKTASTVSLMEVADRIKKIVEDIPDVDRVTTTGYEQKEITVTISPEKMQELGVSARTLMGLVTAATASQPAGSVSTTTSTFRLAIDPQVTTITQLRDLHITVNNQILRLGDIADVEERSKPDQAKSYYATPNTPALRSVNLSVFKSSTADITATERAVVKKVEEEIKAYNGQFEITTVTNTAESITEQFTDLQHNFRDTILLVFIVLVAFLGFRQAIIACFTIPLTFLATFVFMKGFGLSVNFLTMFSLLLALGLLIDDTVVTVQAMTMYDKTNKFTPQETGMLVWRDFIVPIWSTTITTIWAFVPLLLATGIIGEFIKSIPIVVSSTLISSTAIAVLITLPLMIVALKPQIARRVKIMIQIIAFIALMALIFFLSPKNIMLPIVIGLFLLFLVALRVVGTIVLDRIFGGIRKYPRIHRFLNWFNDKFQNGFINMEPMNHGYKNLIKKIIDSRHHRRTVLIMVIIFAVFSYLLVPFGFVQNEFFPKSDTKKLYVNIELPSGTTVSKMDMVTKRLLERLRKIPEVENAAAEVGQSTNVDGGGGGGGGSSNTSAVTLNLKEKTSIGLSERLRKEYADYPDGKVSVIEESGGPPAGSDVQIKLLGDDLNELDKYANQITAFLKKQPGVNNVQKSLKPSTSKLVFVPDYSKLAAEGVSVSDVGQQLRVLASGVTLDNLKIVNEQQDIILRMSNSTESPESIGSLMINTQGGKSLPLTSLGELRLKTNPTVISREDQKRTISVSAGVKAGVNATEINQKLEKFANGELALAPGYSWKTGGANEENAKSVQSIIQAMGLAFLLIFITMVLQFGSFRQAVIALLVIPFAISGVFIVFALSGTPLSFPALIGILALFGIVVTHSMMLMDKINQNRKAGMPFDESIADAGATRLEPILLTSLLTIIGLIPISLSDPFWRGLGGAIIAGLLLTGAIKLFFIPVVYTMWMGGGEKSVDHE